MKIVVIGGTGLVGSKLVTHLADLGHQAVAAAPATGVDTLTGEGLPAALDGTQVVVDVTNSPSFEDEAVLHFFRTSTGTLLDAGAAAGVAHHVVLSVVGTERLGESGYFRAKQAQEELVRASSLASSIVHATQFFEFLGGIADGATDGDTVRLAPAPIQPMAADDVAAAVAAVAIGAPVGGVVEVAGPERFRLDELVQRLLRARHDARRVVADPEARYFGARLDEHTLVPAPGAALGPTRFEAWLAEDASVIRGRS